MKHRTFTLSSGLLLVVLAAIAFAILSDISREYANNAAIASRLPEGTVVHWKSCYPEWLTTILGPEALKRVAVIVCHNTFSDVHAASAAKLRYLETLVIPWSPITSEGVRSLKECTGLVAINLNCTAIDDQALRHIAMLPNLRELRLAWTNVTDSGLGELRQELQIIDVSHTRVTDHGVASIVSDGTLHVICANGTSITDATGRGLGANRSLRMVALNGTSIGDGTIASLIDCKELASLEIASTCISDASADAVARLTSLQLLDAAINNIGDRFCRAACALNELNNLNVAYTRCGDPSLVAISRSPSLDVVCADGTQITANGLAVIVTLKRRSIRILARDVSISMRELTDAVASTADGLEGASVLVLNDIPMSKNEVMQRDNRNSDRYASGYTVPASSQ